MVKSALTGTMRWCTLATMAAFWMLECALFYRGARASVDGGASLAASRAVRG